MWRGASLTGGTTGRDCQASGASVGVAVGVGEGVDVGVAESTVGIADADGVIVAGTAVAVAFAPFVGDDVDGMPAQASNRIKRNSILIRVKNFFTPHPFLSSCISFRRVSTFSPNGWRLSPP